MNRAEPTFGSKYRKLVRKKPFSNQNLRSIIQRAPYVLKLVDPTPSKQQTQNSFILSDLDANSGPAAPGFACAYLILWEIAGQRLLCRGNAAGTNGELKLTSENVHLITSWDIWDKTISESCKDNKIVVANFSASWCNPCRKIAPTYCDLADKYTSLIFITVDVDQLAELANKWEVKATPSFFYLKEGRQIDKIVGGDKEELKKKTAAIADQCSS
ncbi:hypothetical protein ACFE04_019008 [Oxalis oulophora]